MNPGTMGAALDVPLLLARFPHRPARSNGDDNAVAARDAPLRKRERIHRQNPYRTQRETARREIHDNIRTAIAAMATRTSFLRKRAKRRISTGLIVPTQVGERFIPYRY